MLRLLRVRRTEIFVAQAVHERFGPALVAPLMLLNVPMLPS